MSAHYTSLDNGSRNYMQETTNFGGNPIYILKLENLSLKKKKDFSFLNENIFGSTGLEIFKLPQPWIKRVALCTRKHQTHQGIPKHEKLLGVGKCISNTAFWGIILQVHNWKIAPKGGIRYAFPPPILRRKKKRICNLRRQRKS